MASPLVAVYFLRASPSTYVASEKASALRAGVSSHPAPRGFRVDAPWLSWSERPSGCRWQGPRLGAKQHLCRLEKMVYDSTHSRAERGPTNLVCTPRSLNAARGTENGAGGRWGAILYEKIAPRVSDVPSQRSRGLHARHRRVLG